MTRTTIAALGLCVIVLLCCNQPTRCRDSSLAREPIPTEDRATAAPSPPPKPSFIPSTEGRNLTSPPMSRNQIRKVVQTIAHQVKREDVERVYQEIQSFIDRGVTGSGDHLLAMLRAGFEDPAQSAACHALLKTILALAAKVEEQPWFESLDSSVAAIFQVLAQTESEKDPWYALLSSPGVVRSQNLGWMAELSGERAIEAQHVDRLRRILKTVALGADDEAALHAISDCPHRDLRVFAHAELLELDPGRLEEYRDRMVHAPGEREELFDAACEARDQEDIEFLLLDLFDRGVDFDVSPGLSRLLARTEGAGYERILYLHGQGQESDRYRARAVAAISRQITAGQTQESLLDQLTHVCRTDPASDVRGNALLGLSLCWESTDTDGFARFLEELPRDQILASYLDLARQNFSSAIHLRQLGISGPGRVTWAKLQQPDR